MDRIGLTRRHTPYDRHAPGVIEDLATALEKESGRPPEADRRWGNRVGGRHRWRQHHAHPGQRQGKALVDSWRRGRRRRRAHARHGGGVARRAGVVGSGTHRADRHRSARSGTDATTGTRDRAAARRARSRRLRRPDQHGQGRRDRGARRDRGRRAGTAYPANAENSCRSRRASAAGGGTGDPANPDRLRATCGNDGPEPGRWTTAPDVVAITQPLGKRQARCRCSAGGPVERQPRPGRETAAWSATRVRRGCETHDRDSRAKATRTKSCARRRHRPQDRPPRVRANPRPSDGTGGSGRR